MSTRRCCAHKYATTKYIETAITLILTTAFPILYFLAYRNNLCCKYTPRGVGVLTTRLYRFLLNGSANLCF